MSDNKSRKPLWLALILSLSVLLIIVIVYCCERGNDRTSPDGEGSVSAASIVREATINAYNYCSEKVKISIEKARIRRAARKAEKARKKAEKELTTQALKESILGEKYYIKDENGENTDEYIELEEIHTTEPDKYVIYRSEDGNRYIKRLGYYVEGDTAEYRYIPVRTQVDGISFYESEDTVYAMEDLKLYGNPGLTGELGQALSRNESIVRIGKSDKAVYQLVTADGQIVYADGKKLGRYIEATDYTEEIRCEASGALLDVKFIAQNPVLPTGCEVTSLATVLNYYGMDVTKETLADKYLPKAPVGKANFYEEFVGNPRNASSYGCYAPVIVKTAELYFEKENTGYKASDYTGSTFSYLLDKVSMGSPVIVWITSPISAEPDYTTAWIIEGEYLHWKGNLHCVVITGFDISKRKVTVSDPLRGITEYDMDLFIKRYKQMNSQAVIIEPVQ